MRIVRVLTIINHLSMGPETVVSLHKKLTEKGFKVSSRTVYRDLENLEEAFKLGNIKIRRSEGEFNKATWIIVQSETSVHVREDLYFKTFLTEHFKTDWLKSLTGNTIEDVFSHGNIISEQEAAAIQKNISQFSILHSNWGEFIYHREHYNRLKDIIWAISNQRLIHITYFDHTTEVQRLFRPLKAVYHRGAIYLVGFAVLDNQYTIEVQELDCIRATRITNDRFQRPDEEQQVREVLRTRFGIHDTAEGEIHTIRLAMGESPAQFLKNRQWHATQTFTKVGDQWIMEFQCAVNIELVGWIMSWLEHVKVLSPSVLKDNIQERLEYLSRMYRDNLPPVNPSNTDNPFAIGH